VTPRRTVARDVTVRVTVVPVEATDDERRELARRIVAILVGAPQQRDVVSHTRAGGRGDVHEEPVPPSA
jgi:hypothetical protein